MVVENTTMVRFIEEINDGIEIKEEKHEDIINNDENESAVVVGDGGITKEISCCNDEMILVVGYALTSKKTKSFLQPKLECLARLKGIAFVAIDQNKPLLEQGPFDIILHKSRCRTGRLNITSLSLMIFQTFWVQLTGKEWRQVLEDYRQTNPNATVLDPPDAIQHLHNRQTMLQVVADLSLSDCYGTVNVPKQLVVKKDASSISYAVARAGLNLPLVAKPLMSDGSSKSHELSLAFDQYSIKKLEPPLVLQEFVNHGGVLFKVFVVGETIKVVRRFSLPNVSKRELTRTTGVYRFPRVSCAAASADDADLEPGVAELPLRPLLEKLVRGLQRRLGLQLFNLDMIREYGTRDNFYVIDINYFPGYGKMPEYEHIFTDFLLSFMRRKCDNRLISED